MVSKAKKYLIQLIIIILVLAIWEIIVKLFNISHLILPLPSSIIIAYIKAIVSGTLLSHTFVTLNEAFFGFVLGAIVGVVLGYLLSKSVLAEKILSPYIIAVQTVPKLALAPLILIWFGFGIFSKILITALVVFFPIFINVLFASKSINFDLRELMKVTKASRWQIFTKLEIPHSLPVLFAGFKSSITLAIVGAVVGEFIGSSKGLGYLIMFHTGNLNTIMVFVAILQLTLLGFILYKITSKIGSYLTPWHESEKQIEV